MPIRHAIWKVGASPKPLFESSLATEQLLEDMIVAEPHIISDEWMLIGRQENTGFGGRIDLLAIAPDGTLVLLELKKARTPREVVAQAIDYASWVENLRAEDIVAIYGRFKEGHNLAEDFQQEFGIPLDETTLNQSHQIIIVASSLDDSTERIVTYLNKREIAINVLYFQVFSHGTEQLLSRAWLLDPGQTQVNATITPTTTNESWNGEFYGSFGEGSSRSWNEAIQYGFFSAGGGQWYTRTLRLLNVDDRIWVKVPNRGFVGVGRVTGPAQPATAFQVSTPSGEKPVLDVVQEGNYHQEVATNPDLCEYFVPVQWLQTVPVQNAVQEIGLFGNQNSVCKPTTPKWRHTVEYLKEKFPNYDK